MRILHPFAGSLQQYIEALSDPNRYRLNHCPQCGAQLPLIGHGFYSRTLVDGAFEGVIRVRRYLCRACRRTVSLLPEFALPYLRFSVSVIALFLIARLLEGRTLVAAGLAASQPHMPQSGVVYLCRSTPSRVLSKVYQRAMRGEMSKRWEGTAESVTRTKGC